MEEILFIGKSKDTNEWVMGYYSKANIESATSNKIVKVLHFISGHEIFPESLGQYVGLKDKNDKKIFTGHIVLSSNGTPCEVVLKDFEYIIRTKYRELKHRLEEYDEGKFEVIGNIYDNPELLENK